jgi:23S rRNA pseudouridine1911/1915/1917 synthase
VECELETGRTHQIRVHLTAIGHPIVGDQTYGGQRKSVPISRPFLHAQTLGFTHPTSGERLTFQCELPPDLTELLDRCS